MYGYHFTNVRFSIVVSELVLNWRLDMYIIQELCKWNNRLRFGSIIAACTNFTVRCVITNRTMHSWFQAHIYRQCHRCVAPGPRVPTIFRGPPTDVHQTFFSYHKISHVSMNFRLRFCIRTTDLPYRSVGSVCSFGIFSITYRNSFGGEIHVTKRTSL